MLFWTKVDLHIIFTWQAVVESVRKKEVQHVLYTNFPVITHVTYPSILCDLCFCWHHLHCLNLKCVYKAQYWFSRTCTELSHVTEKEQKSCNVSIVHLLSTIVMSLKGWSNVGDLMYWINLKLDKSPMRSQITYKVAFWNANIWSLVS